MYENDTNFLHKTNLKTNRKFKAQRMKGLVNSLGRRRGEGENLCRIQNSGYDFSETDKVFSWREKNTF